MEDADRESEFRRNSLRIGVGALLLGVLLGLGSLILGNDLMRSAAISLSGVGLGALVGRSFLRTG